MNDARVAGRQRVALGHAVRLVRQHARREASLLAVLLVVTGLASGAELWIIGRLLARITDDAAGANSVGLLVTLGLVLTGQAIATSVSSELETLVYERCMHAATEQLLDSALSNDLLAFEDPAWFDRFERARESAATKIWSAVWGLATAGVAAVACVIAAVILASINPLLVVVLTVAFVPVALVHRWNANSLYQFAYGQSSADRERRYLARLLTDRSSAAELRAGNAARFLQDRHSRLAEARLTKLTGVIKRRLARLAFTNLVIAATTTGVCAVLLGLAASDRLTVADAGVAVLAVRHMISRLRSGSQALSSLDSSTLFLQDYAAVVRLDVDADRRHGRSATPSSASLDNPAREAVGLLARDLGFQYPGSDRWALRHVDLEIAPGMVVAIVGENGSGKTTLAKLLCGLYPPSEGAAEWAHAGAASPATEHAHEATVLFQDYIRYQLTARENIGLGDVARINDDAAIAQSAADAGIARDIDELKHGFATRLGREYDDSSDLSVGQWQRLALARALFKSSGMLLLDEPTSALDPVAEARVFADARRYATDRTVVLISHRLAGVREADLIVVLRHGSIVEQGTHAALMERHGDYSAMVALQSRS